MRMSFQRDLQQRVDGDGLQRPRRVVTDPTSVGRILDGSGTASGQVCRC
jgi:hypothetical protein